MSGHQLGPLFIEVSVHDVDAVEVGLGGELVGTCDLYHPVDHFGPQGGVDVVVAQELGWLLEVAVVVEDFGGVEVAVLLGVGLRGLFFGSSGDGGGLEHGGDRLISCLVAHSFEVQAGHDIVAVPSLVAMLMVVLLLVEGLAISDIFLHLY